MDDPNGGTRSKGEMAGQVRGTVPRSHAEAHKFVMWFVMGGCTACMVKSFMDR